MCWRSLLQELPDGRVVVSRACRRFRLPQTCFSRSWLGVKCPGCGLTRSIIHLAEGDWQASWRDHRLGGLFAIVIALQIPYRLLALRGRTARCSSPRWQAVLGLCSNRSAPGELAAGSGGRPPERDLESSTARPLPTVAPAHSRRGRCRCPNRTHLAEIKPVACRHCPGRESPTRAPSCSSARPATWHIASWCPLCFSLPGAGTFRPNAPSSASPAATGPTPTSAAEYEKTLCKDGGADFRDVWSQFANRIFFSPGTFDDPASYQKLKETLERVDQDARHAGQPGLLPGRRARVFRRRSSSSLGEAGLIYPGHQERPGAAW